MKCKVSCFDISWALCKRNDLLSFGSLRVEDSKNITHCIASGLDYSPDTSDNIHCNTLHSSCNTSVHLL